MDPIKCCICYDNVSLEAKTSCDHFICQECVSNICTTACPMCRKDPFESIYITDEILESIKERHSKQCREISRDFPRVNNNGNMSDRSQFWSVFNQIFPPQPFPVEMLNRNQLSEPQTSSDQLSEPQISSQNNQELLNALNYVSNFAVGDERVFNIWTGSRR